MSHTSVPPCVFPQSQLMDAAREVYKRCDELAEISCLKAGIGRYYLSPEHKVCNLKVADWMRSAGLEAWQDQAGNCWGRLRSKNPKLGSVCPFMWISQVLAMKRGLASAALFSAVRRWQVSGRNSGLSLWMPRA